MFSARTYVARRQVLSKELGSGAILFLGNDHSPMNYAANVYPFHQDSTFLYYCGIDHPELAVLLDLDEDREILFGNEASMDDIIWMGNKPGIKEKALETGIQQTAPLNQLGDTLAKLKVQGRRVHYLPQYRSENILKIFQLLKVHPKEEKQSASVPLIKAVVKQRSRKTDEELTELDQAATLTGRMHLKALEMARPGLSEATIAAAMQEIALNSGPGLPFPIVATIHGEILHNESHTELLQSGNLMLIDAGAESPCHYAGDMTRTFPVDKKFTQKQKEIYQIVLSAQQAAIQALKPVVRFLDIHLKTCRNIAQGLKDVDCMRGDLEEAVAQGAHALFFPHGLGHMLGLDVHDMESLGEEYIGYNDTIKRSTQFGLNTLRLARELETNFVITIEPGLYFIPALIEQWKAEKRFSQFINYDKIDTYKEVGGIRIEDDAVITETGFRLLGSPVPKTIAEIESLRA